MAESTDMVILQLKIQEGTGKKLPEAKKEVETLATSIVGLAKANKQLRDERNKLDITSADGAKRIQELNKLIDENNDLIKQNSSNLEKQRMNVGNYKRGVTDALKELRIGGVNVGDVVDKLSKANEDLFQGMIQGYKQSGIAAKLFGTTARTALTLTGIGIIIAGLTTMIAYWDDITDAIGLTDKASRAYHEQAQKDMDAHNSRLEYQLRLMQALGVSQRDQLTFQIEEMRKAIALEEGLLNKITEQAQNDKVKKLGKRAEEYQVQKVKVQELNAELLILISELAKLDADAAKEAADKAAAEAEKAREARAKANEKERQEKEKQIEEDRKLKEEQDEAEKERLADLVEAHFDALEAQSEAEKQYHAELRKLREETARQEEEEAKKAEQRRQKEIDSQRALTHAKINLAATIGNTLSQLAGENKALAIAAVVIEKAAAIAGIISNTAIANAKAVAASPLTLGMPWVGINTATGIAAGVGVAAQAATSISQISGFAQGGEFKPKKYSYGGPILVGGRSHAEGGTTYRGEDGNAFEVEKDEGIFILKKSANKEYLSSLNQAHGGKSWGQKTWYAEQGGQIETREASANSRSSASMERAMRSALQNIDFYVRIDDINNSQQTGNEIKLKGRVL
jgi:hypothetical protein